MSNYLHDYDNPDDAYQEALRRIKKVKAEGTTELDLSRLGLIAVPPEIEQLTALETLFLYKNNLTAIPPKLGN
jgi:Leucine-rich repeat (LRR) protein